MSTNESCFDSCRMRAAPSRHSVLPTRRTEPGAALIEGTTDVSDWETDAYLAEARKYASAASYDVQRLAPDSEARQALHNVVLTLDAILAVLENTPSTSVAGDAGPL